MDKIAIDVGILSTTQAAVWSDNLDQAVGAYSLGYALVKTDLEIMDEIHKFEDLPTMLGAISVPDDLMSTIRKTMTKVIVEEVPSARKALVKAARELVEVLREKVKLIHQLLRLTRSELGRETTAADYEFERRYRKLVTRMA